MLKKALAGLLMAAFTAVAAPAAAQDAAISVPATSPVADQQAMQYASALHFGYITGPSPVMNDEVRMGMEALTMILRERTSVQPAGVVAIDIERDDIAFFPFIYFPVEHDTPPLSPQAQRKLQNYLDNGGFVMIDTRDYGAVVQQPRDLARVLGAVNIRALVPVPEDHVLTRSFYLVNGMPGTVPDGAVWIEQPGAPGSESVTSVIIGGRNWAGAWAATTLPHNARQREDALRAGVNIVMHALTGNYKQDQTHIDAVLERMER